MYIQNLLEDHASIVLENPYATQKLWVAINRVYYTLMAQKKLNHGLIFLAYRKSNGKVVLIIGGYSWIF
jgi:hypothetical protein